MNNKTLRIILAWLVLLGFIWWVRWFNPIIWDNDKDQYMSYTAEITIIENQMADNSAEHKIIQRDVVNPAIADQLVLENANIELKKQIEQLKKERELVFIK